MSTSRRFLGYFFSLALLVATLAAIWQRQAVTDWWRLRNYNPPPAIAALAGNTAMTDNARHIFYVNHPALSADKQDFRTSCAFSEQTIVLGCYIGGQRGIYIYDVTDPQLDGVEQVTAAHEMLHAAYERLSDDEKQQIDAQLTEYFENELTDERIKTTIDGYRQTEPTELVNEMHSIFGTEIRSLPAGLETYYSRYFTDRSRVVSYAEAYEAVFTANKQQLDNIKKQIETTKGQLPARQQSIDAEQAALAAERDRMNSLQANGQIAEFNAAVGPYNARVQALRDQIAAYNAKVKEVNELVERYNQLALAKENLIKAIDNRL